MGNESGKLFCSESGVCPKATVHHGVENELLDEAAACDSAGAVFSETIEELSLTCKKPTLILSGRWEPTWLNTQQAQQVRIKYVQVSFLSNFPLRFSAKERGGPFAPLVLRQSKSRRCPMAREAWGQFRGLRYQRYNLFTYSVSQWVRCHRHLA